MKVQHKDRSGKCSRKFYLDVSFDFTDDISLQSRATTKHLGSFASHHEELGNDGYSSSNDNHSARLLLSHLEMISRSLNRQQPLSMTTTNTKHPC